MSVSLMAARHVGVLRASRVRERFAPGIKGTDPIAAEMYPKRSQTRGGELPFRGQRHSFCCPRR